MDDWKRLISRGNRCFERGDTAKARAVFVNWPEVARRFAEASQRPS